MTLSSALTYTARPRVVAKYAGELCLPVAVLAVVPCAITAAYGEYGMSATYAAAAAVLAGVGFLSRRMPKPKDIQTNEAYAIISLVFILVPAVMAVAISRAGLGYLDAYCTAVSASTTTGLRFSAGADSTTLPLSLAWMQWYGGLGILVFSLALFLHPGRRTKDLASVEIPKTDLLVGTRVYARTIIFYYAALSVAGFSALMLTGLPIELAAPLAMGSVSTGGPATASISAGPLSLVQQSVLAAFCLLGALPFTMTVRILRLKHTEMLELSEIAAILGLILLMTAVLAGCLVLNEGYSMGETLELAPIMAVFVQTTSGYASLDFSGLSDATMAIMIPFMAAGGGIGSTAGGFKGLRLLIGLSVIRSAIRSSRMPAHAHHKPTLMNRVVDDEFTHDALQVTFLFLIASGAAWLIFLLAGYAGSESLFLVISAASNSGYAYGIDPQALPAGLKLLLAILMILGRLELLAVLAAFSPGNWFGRTRGY